MTDTPHDDEGPLRERIIALEAENARLREALERIAEGEGGILNRLTARAALAALEAP